MTLRTRRLQINRQQKNILLLSLFMLKHKLGKNRPEKKQVIAYIKIKGLIAIRDEDRKIVSSGEEAWANDIAWRREDLKNEGFLKMQFRGEWQITDAGEARLIEWVTILHYFSTIHSDWEDRLQNLEELFEEKIVITRETVEVATEAYEIASQQFPTFIPEITEQTKGRIKL